MGMRTTELSTADGVCRTQVFTPDHGAGPWPAVVFCMDGGGQRPSLYEMAARLAHEGYVVAMPDLFHRAGDVLELLPPDGPREARALFPLLRDPEVRGRWHKRFYLSATDEAHLRTDIGATLEHLGQQREVRPGPVA